MCLSTGMFCACEPELAHWFQQPTPTQDDAVGMSEVPRPADTFGGARPARLRPVSVLRFGGQEPSSLLPGVRLLRHAGPLWPGAGGRCDHQPPHNMAAPSSDGVLTGPLS
jgi:hypothetical protein